jgi:cytoskeletal protein CcmA (bactofilin family)
LSIVGRLECAGDLQIEGSIEGEVRGQGVRIGNGAVVKGTVVGEIVQLSGTVEGNIEADSVILAKNAHVSGDISYQSLQIEEGAYFSGHSRPKRKETPRPALVEVSQDASNGCYVSPGRPAEIISEVA